MWNLFQPAKESSMSTWDYADLTNEAEYRIRQLMEAAQGKPEAEAQRLRQMAQGVYILWDSVTLGSRPGLEGPNDAMRLMLLMGPYQFAWREELGLPPHG
jgi:hypothetical protein